MAETTLLLLALVLLGGCWLAVGVRRVREGQWVAVTRRGVVRRVSVEGWAWRLPLLERFEQDLTEVLDLPIQVRAETRDGVRVHVLAEATVALPRPVVGAPYADPWPAAERAAEAAIARAVTGWSAADLTQSAAASTRTLRRQVGAAVDTHGVQVDEVTLVEVDVPLHGSR